MISIRSERLNMKLSKRTLVDGLWVGAFSGKEHELIQKVCEALALIKRCDEVRYKHILRDVKKVWVIPLPGLFGVYRVETESCQIDRRFVESSHPTFIASVIVHEACHARLRNLGYSEAVRVRMEEICLKQEYIFAGKHAGGAAVVDWLDSFPPIQPENYTDEARAELDRQGSIEVARYLGMPDWLVRCLLRVRDFREKRASQRRQNQVARQRP